MTTFKIGRYDQFTNYTDSGSVLTSFPDGTVPIVNKELSGRREMVEGTIEDWNIMLHKGTGPKQVTLSLNVRDTDETSFDAIATHIYSRPEKVLYLSSTKFLRCWGQRIRENVSGSTPSHTPAFIDFICPDPRLYSNTLDEPTDTIADDSVTVIDASSLDSGSLANAGSAPTDITLEVTCGTGGTSITKIQFCDQKYVSDGNNDITQPSSSSALAIVSDDAGDTTQKIEVFGLSGGSDTAETVSLNGTTPVNTSNAYTKIYYIELDSDADGTVTSTSNSGVVTNATIATTERSATIKPDPTDSTTYLRQFEWNGTLAADNTLTIHDRKVLSNSLYSYKALVPEMNGQTSSSIAGTMSGTKNIQISAGAGATVPKYGIKLTANDASSTVILRHRDAWWIQWR